MTSEAWTSVEPADDLPWDGEEPTFAEDDLERARLNGASPLGPHDFAGDEQEPAVPFEGLSHAVAALPGERGTVPLFSPLDSFLRLELPRAEPLLGTPGETYMAVGSLFVVTGDAGSGKSTHAVDGIAHLAAGADWLEIPVPRPVRILVIENEGPAALWQQKLAAKAETWEGPDWRHNVHVLAEPWGAFSFAHEHHREPLAAYCDENEIELVVANPTLALGVAGSGRPEETQRFVDLLARLGLRDRRAFWLLHYTNKAGQSSGDWDRHGDTNVRLEPDGNRPRTKLTWTKTRWASLPNDERQKTCLLEWVPATQGYTVVELDTVGASDNELRARINDYLDAHPRASTTSVERDVKGTATRIRSLLETGGYRAEPGARRATLWSLPGDPVELFESEPTE